jgi:hypothetical protein
MGRRHSFHCGQAFWIEGNPNPAPSGYQRHLNIHNCLLSDIGNDARSSALGPVFAGSFWTADAQHLTIDKCPILAPGDTEASYQLKLVNSLFSLVTYLGGSQSIIGDTNGFDPSSPVFGTVQVIDTDAVNGWPFAVPDMASDPYGWIVNAQAAYYLREGSPFFDVGTPNIDATLKADLARMTSMKPELFMDDVNSSMTLSPVNIRETSATPSLGYHYPAIDYVISGATVNNCTLNIDQGTVLAFTPAAALYEWGLRLNPGGRLNVNGVPTNRVVFARLEAVQEAPQPVWSGPCITFKGVFLPSGAMVTPLPEARFHYADFPTLAGDAIHFGGLTGDETYDCVKTLELDGCHFQGGSFVYESGGPADRSIKLRNTIFERSLLVLQNRCAQTHGGNEETFEAFNNLFYDCDMWLAPVGSAWTFNENIFDQSAFHFTGNVNVNNQNNAYVKMSGARLQPTTYASTDKVLSQEVGYETGPLGRFYLPNGSQLLNGGNRTAGQAGLYHFTSRATNQKQQTALVNIGPAYLALDANGRPCDSNGDGVADFIADRNGDGAESGEIPWQTQNGSALTLLAPPQQPISGKVVIGVNPGSYATRARSLRVIIVDPPSASAASGIQYSINPYEIELDTRCWPNGPLTFKVQAILSDYNSGLQYSTTDSAAVTVTLDNPIGYPAWSEWSGDSTAVFNFALQQTADSCAIDVFDSDYPKSYVPLPVAHVETAPVNGQVSGSLPLESASLKGGSIHPRLYSVATAIQGGAATTSPQTGPVMLQDQDFPEAGYWYIAYEDSYRQTYDPDRGTQASPVEDTLQPMSTQRWFHDGALEGWKGVAAWPDPSHAAPNVLDDPVSGVSGTWPQTWPIRYCDYSRDDQGRLSIDPYVLSDWSLFCRRIADPNIRNLYIGAHMTPTSLAFLPVAQLKRLVQGRSPHRYHFVFLDGCESGASDGIACVFGFDSTEILTGVWGLDYYQNAGCRPAGGVVFNKSYHWFVGTPLDMDHEGYIPKEFAQFYMIFQGKWTLEHLDLRTALLETLSEIRPMASASGCQLQNPPWMQDCAQVIGYVYLHHNQYNLRTDTW